MDDQTDHNTGHTMDHLKPKKDLLRPPLIGYLICCAMLTLTGFGIWSSHFGPINEQSSATHNSLSNQGGLTSKASTPAETEKQERQISSRKAVQNAITFDDLNNNDRLYLDKELRRFKTLTDKVLLSNSHKTELKELSNSEQLLMESHKRLTHYDKEEQQGLARRSRMVAISALQFIH